MIQKIDYELKTDKRGRKIAYRIDLKTGKKKQIKYKIAQKRVRDIKYRQKRAKIEAKLKKTGSGATYKEYKKMSVIVEKEIRAKAKKSKKPMPSDAAIKNKVKKTVIQYRTGIATKYRYAWKYWLIESEFINEYEEHVVICDESPVFIAHSLKKEGNEFDIMVSICDEIYDDIMAQDLCPQKLEGGACVVLYNKSDWSVIKKYELGYGCTYDKYENMFVKQDNGDYDEL